MNQGNLFYSNQLQNDRGSFLRVLVIKVLNCFSENASNCPLKVKTILFAFISMLPLKETVNFWKSSMILSLQKKLIY